MTFDKFDVLGVRIGAINLESACRIIEDWIRNGTKTYVCIVPVSTIVSAVENEEYRRIINEAGLATPDGMPVAWLGRAKGYSTVERTYGPDLLLETCRISEEKDLTHYFYGGEKKSLELLEFNLKKRFPRLKIAGRYSPPFRPLSKEEDENAIADINKAHPDILWVGLGSPKQDFWMAEHRNKLNVPVMVAVGAAFDFLSGAKPQAPLWMQRAGLEWLFRFVCEPRRLWKRYLFGNVKFLYYLLQGNLKKPKVTADAV